MSLGGRGVGRFFLFNCSFEIARKRGSVIGFWYSCEPSVGFFFVHATNVHLPRFCHGTVFNAVFSCLAMPF